MVGVVGEVVGVVVVAVVVTSRGAVTFVRKPAILKRWKERSLMAALQVVVCDPVKLTGVWAGMSESSPS